MTIPCSFLPVSKFKLSYYQAFQSTLSIAIPKHTSRITGELENVLFAQKFASCRDS